MSGAASQGLFGALDRRGGMAVVVVSAVARKQPRSARNERRVKRALSQVSEGGKWRCVVRCELQRHVAMAT